MIVARAFLRTTSATSSRRHHLRTLRHHERLIIARPLPWPPSPSQHLHLPEVIDFSSALRIQPPPLIQLLHSRWDQRLEYLVSIKKNIVSYRLLFHNIKRCHNSSKTTGSHKESWKTFCSKYQTWNNYVENSRSFASQTTVIHFQLTHKDL